ncbi:1-alkyl-2-acetylglycerophosphocholine esterase [Synchytrium endobioticum]|uniref:1-alkyl-2-acetylglycerophosphocholine esterase n=1 Tax=Synchytrium endobioticum TaxID=286115 RepID=A0A507CA32_9FUNG|nr:1-alkyl-2-acetylglycerophosphocholine esterase [Synchytrium endobioticum]
MDHSRKIEHPVSRAYTGTVKAHRGLPNYSGPFPVGCLDIETKPLSSSSASASDVGVLFRLFYPTDPSTFKKFGLARWTPSLDYAKAYGTTFGLPLLLAYLVIPIFYSHRTPSRYRAPLMPPIKSGRHPVASSICGDLASHGFIVASIEHRDGSAVHSHVGGKHGRVVKYVDWRHKEKECNGSAKALWDWRLGQQVLRASEVQACIRTLTDLNEGKCVESYYEKSTRRIHLTNDHWIEWCLGNTDDVLYQRGNYYNHSRLARALAFLQLAVGRMQLMELSLSAYVAQRKQLPQTEWSGHVIRIVEETVHSMQGARMRYQEDVDRLIEEWASNGTDALENDVMPYFEMYQRDNEARQIDLGCEVAAIWSLRQLFALRQARLASLPERVELVQQRTNSTHGRDELFSGPSCVRPCLALFAIRSGLLRYERIWSSKINLRPDLLHREWRTSRPSKAFTIIGLTILGMLSLIINGNSWYKAKQMGGQDNQCGESDYHSSTLLE